MIDALKARLDGYAASAAARDRYAEWIARGRAHQGAGRPIDALLCYRQALRVARGADAQFHIGEVVWRLGRHAEAVAAWRAATEIAPRIPRAGRRWPNSPLHGEWRFRCSRIRSANRS